MLSLYLGSSPHGPRPRKIQSILLIFPHQIKKVIICMEWRKWFNDRRIRSWILDLKNFMFQQLSVFIRRQALSGKVPFWKGFPLQLGKHTSSKNTVWVGLNKPNIKKKKLSSSNILSVFWLSKLLQRSFDAFQWIPCDKLSWTSVFFAGQVIVLEH